MGVVLQIDASITGCVRNICILPLRAMIIIYYGLIFKLLFYVCISVCVCVSSLRMNSNHFTLGQTRNEVITNSYCVGNENRLANIVFNRSPIWCEIGKFSLMFEFNFISHFSHQCANQLYLAWKCRKLTSIYNRWDTVATLDELMNLKVE